MRPLHPASPTKNTLDYTSCYSDQTYTGCIASSSSGNYNLSAGNISSDIQLQFNTSGEPALGLYNIEAYPCKNCRPGYVELYLLASGNLLSTPDGRKLYLQKIGGKITATFWGLKVSNGSCTTTVSGRLKAN